MLYIINNTNIRGLIDIQTSRTTTHTTYSLGGCYDNDGITERLWLGGGYYGAPVVLEVTDTMQYRYIMRDHLGSITHIYTVEPVPVLLQELSYDAWGRLRNPDTHVAYISDSVPTPILGRGYTGHRHIADIGLIDMNARLYDPMLGRFLSPDPHIQSPDCPQNYNRYTYCLNNPLRYVDPSGEVYYTTNNKFEIERFLNEFKYGNAKRVLNNYNFSNWTKYDVLSLSVNSPNGVAYLMLMPSSQLSVSRISSNSFEITDYEVIAQKILFYPYSFSLLPLSFDTAIDIDTNIEESSLKLPEWTSDANTIVGAYSIAHTTKQKIIDKHVKDIPEFNKYIKYTNRLGLVCTGLSIGYTAYDWWKYYDENGFDTTKTIQSGVDIAMSVVGMAWPYGTLVSTLYFLYRSY